MLGNYQQELSALRLENQRMKEINRELLYQLNTVHQDSQKISPNSPGKTSTEPSSSARKFEDASKIHTLY